MTLTISPTTTGAIVPAGQGERIAIFDEVINVKVSGEQTGGAYAVIAISVAPGGGPPLHAHPTSETFAVLSGEFDVTVRDGQDVSTARIGPGDLAHAPAGVPHRFENAGDARGTLLIVGDPAMLAFLREMGEAFPPGAAPDMERMLAINTKHGAETFHGGAGSRPEPPKDGATSAGARALGWRFAQVNQALIETLERCTEAEWRATCADTGWSVGVQAHHIAVTEPVIAGLVRDTAAGHPHPPMPAAKLDEINARHAREFADISLADTLALLRANGAAAATTYRELRADQLGMTTVLSPGAPPVTLAQVIDFLAIGEIERHGAEIHKAIRR